MGTKKAGRALIAALAVAICAAAARAQGQPGEQGQGQAHGQGQGQGQFFDPNNEAEHFANHLKLDAAQKAKVLELLKQKLALFKKTAAETHQISLRQAELSKRIQHYNERMQVLSKTQDEGVGRISAGIRAVLDDEQKKKFDAMEQERIRQQKEFEAAHGGPGQNGDQRQGGQDQGGQDQGGQQQGPEGPR